MHSPYPYESLPKLTRAQARAVSALHALGAGLSLDEAQRCASALLGTDVSCAVGAPEVCPAVELAARSGRPAVWIELESADDRLWLELPIGLCEHVAERALGSDAAPSMLASGTTLDELSLGALAYVVARVIAATTAPFRLRALASSPPSDAGVDLVRWGAAVHSGNAQAAVQLYVPAKLLADARAERLAARRFAALPLALWADAGYARVRLTTLRSLEPGDVLVLDHASVIRDAQSRFRGTASVRVEGSASALLCRVRDGCLEVETIACTSEPTMTSGRRIPEASDPPAAELARDVPVEVSLEIARFRLTLGELERVQPGDVLATGRAIGERVTLRAAGQPVAEGELVDVEGELGVRVTKLIGPATE